MTEQTQDKYVLRLPDGLRDEIKGAADQNMRSMNAEMIYRLKGESTVAEHKQAGRGSDQFPLRLPDGLRDRIKEAAERNGRSMNTEIISRLQETFGAKEDVAALLRRALASIEAAE